MLIETYYLYSFAHGFTIQFSYQAITNDLPVLTDEHTLRNGRTAIPNIFAQIIFSFAYIS